MKHDLNEEKKAKNIKKKLKVEIKERGQFRAGSYATAITHIQPYKIFPIWISCCLPNLGCLLIQNIRWK